MVKSIKADICALSRVEINRLCAFENVLDICDDVVKLRQIISRLKEFEDVAITKTYIVEQLADVDVSDQFNMTDKLRATYNGIVDAAKKAVDLSQIDEVNETCELFIEELNNHRLGWSA
jgi:hypothetical protein